MGEWQHRDTAPQDGKPFLFHITTGTFCVARVRDGLWSLPWCLTYHPPEGKWIPRPAPPIINSVEG